MKVFLTGGTGFIGGHVARLLRERGDDVVALVRTPSKAGPLKELGCDLFEGDLGSMDRLAEGMRGCDSVIHSAAIYEVGISAADCEQMRDVNIAGTERVFDAAEKTGVKRVTYVSTVGYFGNTKGKVVDESFIREDDGHYLSCYDETKLKAHDLAFERMKKGAPIVIAQPGGVYGPGQDDVGQFVIKAATGRFRYKTFPEVGLNMGYVDDIAEGIVLVHDKGNLGESYVLGGEITTLGEVVDKVSELLGKKPPRFTMPPWMVKSAIPLAPVVTRIMGLGPNLREYIRTADGVTFWATDAKARRELGYSPRSLEDGLRQTVEAGI